MFHRSSLSDVLVRLICCDNGWTESKADDSLENGACVICRKFLSREQLGISLSFVAEQDVSSSRCFVCRMCFERDVELCETVCSCVLPTTCFRDCFVCEEKLMQEEEYSLEITHNGSMFCVHFHKECFEASTTKEFYFCPHLF